jgi:hypothetical protein
VYYCDGRDWPIYAYLRHNSNVPIEPIADSIPSPLTWQGGGGGVAINSLVTFPSITPSDFEVPAPISVIGGEYSIDRRPYTSSPGTISPGESFRVRFRASSAYSTQSKPAVTTATIVVGGMDATFTAITDEGSYTLRGLSFASVANAAPNSIVLSARVVPVGFTVPVSVTIIGGEFSINGGAFQSMPGTLSPGQSIQLRARTGQFVEVTAGSARAIFVVRERSADQVPVTVIVSGIGTVRMPTYQLSCETTCQIQVERSDPRSFTDIEAFPSVGQVFLGWEGCDIPSGRLCYFSTPQGRQIVAKFSSLPPLPTLTRRGGFDTTLSGVAQVLAEDDAGGLMRGVVSADGIKFEPFGQLEPGAEIEAIGDINGDGRSDIVLRKSKSATFDDILLARNSDISDRTTMRQVKSAWEVQATADLDGDGFDDLVWRYTEPNSRDTGVSYIWFSSGTGVSQVRKRGGAPLDWKIIGAKDINGDGAADLFYLSCGAQ